MKKIILSALSFLTIFLFASVPAFASTYSLVLANDSGFTPGTPANIAPGGNVILECVSNGSAVYYPSGSTFIFYASSQPTVKAYNISSSYIGAMSVVDDGPASGYPSGYHKYQTQEFPSNAFYVGLYNTGSATLSYEGMALAIMIIPAAPSGLTVPPSSVTTTGLTLSWNAVTNASTYNVYENGKKIASGVSTTSYQVTGLTPGTTYSFTVTGANFAGESTQSAPISALTLAAPPTGIKTSDISQSGATVSWDAVPGALSYQVYINGRLSLSTMDTSNIITGLSSDQTYQVAIATLNSSGTGPTSSPVSFTTLKLIMPPVGPVTTTGTPGGTGTVSWTPDPSAPTGTVYTVDQNGNPVGTTTGTSITVSPYDPNSVYTVTAGAPGYTTSQGAAGGVFSGQTPKWGMSANDILTNSAALIASVGGILLLVLTLMFGPRLVRFIKSLIRRKDSDPLVYEPIEYDAMEYGTNKDSYNYENVSMSITTDITPIRQQAETELPAIPTNVSTRISSDVETSVTTNTETKVRSDIGTYDLEY